MYKFRIYESGKCEYCNNKGILNPREINRDDERMRSNLICIDCFLKVDLSKFHNHLWDVHPKRFNLFVAALHLLNTHKKEEPQRNRLEWAINLSFLAYKYDLQNISINELIEDQALDIFMEFFVNDNEIDPIIEEALEIEDEELIENFSKGIRQLVGNKGA